jgi:ribonucleoside-triphosphate reductase
MKIQAKDKKVPVECYSRVVGYFRPLNQWNMGKQEEFKDRLPYDANKFE